MADNHPFAAHRDHHVQKERVPHITRGYASGGAVNAVESGGAPTRKAVKQRDALAVTGKPARQRLDRPTNRARGGRTGGKHKTNVNVIVAPQGHSPAPAAGVAAGPTPPPALAARPPVPPPGLAPPGLAPPGLGPPGAGPLPPPGMPPRKHGGRNYKHGGGVKSGPAFEEGKKHGTQVQHTNNKQDGKDIGRGPVITKAAGGPVEHPLHGGMGPNLHGGGHGGKARLAKAHRAAGKHA